MAKLSELLTGDPSTWRRVRLKNQYNLYGWVQFEHRVSNGEYVGIAEYFESVVVFSDNGDWEYYEESKPSYEKSKIPFPACYLKEDNSIAHVFIDENLSCQCGVQKRLSGRISFMNAVDAKPKVTRWLWAYKGKNGGYFNSAQFLTEEETKGYQWMGCTHVTKLPWTETEFES